MEEAIQIKNKKFVLTRTVAEHEDHSTFIATWSGRTYCIRTYKTGFEEAMKNYKILKHAGINMAKICFHDDVNHVIVFDYFPESSVLTTLSQGPLPEIYFQAMFDLYRFARFSKVCLDWEPQNFMLRGSQMFYLPTKYEPLNDKNKFELTGLRTWFLGKEGHDLLRRKGFDDSKLVSLSEAEVNKATVLAVVKFYDSWGHR